MFELGSLGNIAVGYKIEGLMRLWAKSLLSVERREARRLPTMDFGQTENRDYKRGK